MLERGAAQPRVPRRSTGGRGRALLTIGVWLALIAGFQLYARHEQLSSRELLEGLIRTCRSSSAGPLVFLGAAALSPLLLVPAALLGAVAGVCFGPVLGVVYTLIGCNVSATISYLVGRFSRASLPDTGRLRRMVDRYGPRLRRNGFWGVVVLRLSFLPYDAVNYLIGLLRVRWGVFIVANTLGSLPGVLAIVLAGASILGAGRGLPYSSPPILVGTAVLLLSVGGAAALWLRERRTA